MSQISFSIALPVKIEPPLISYKTEPPFPHFEPAALRGELTDDESLPAQNPKRMRTDFLRANALARKSAEPYGMVKLGEQRRALIKASISEKTLTDESLRERCKAIAKIKVATVSELMRMCEICGILPWALNLVHSRKTETRLPKIVD